MSPTCLNKRDHPLQQLVVGVNLLKTHSPCSHLRIRISNESSPQKVAHFLNSSCIHRDSSCIPSQIVSFSFRRHQTSTGWSALQTREELCVPISFGHTKGVRFMAFTVSLSQLVDTSKTPHVVASCSRRWHLLWWAIHLAVMSFKMVSRTMA